MASLAASLENGAGPEGLSPSRVCALPVCGGGRLVSPSGSPAGARAVVLNGEGGTERGDSWQRLGSFFWSIKFILGAPGWFSHSRVNDS